MLASIALAAIPSAAQPIPATLVQSTVPDGSDGRSIAVARMVRGILGYTHWPAEPAVIAVCIAGIARFAGRIDGMAQPTGRRIDARALAVTASPATARCNALYLGRMAGPERAALIAGARGRGIVTIDENDPLCRGGAMFCLNIGVAQLSFELDLDAVSRSGLRIDPKVLLLSRPEPDA